MAVDREVTWDGVTLRSSIKDWISAGRDKLADAAREGDWPTVFEVLDKHPEWVNTCRIGGTSGYAPLHQAAWHGTDAGTVTRLVEIGAWRTLRTADGERALDIADRNGRRHLAGPLTPVIRHSVDPAVRQAIQRHFHALIRERTEELVTTHRLRLPELEPLTEQEVPRCWFAVPGMYGGFNYGFVGDTLVVESWSRVVGGSGRRHVIDEHGARLVDSGFV